MGHRTGLRVHPHRLRTSWACLFLEESAGDVGSAQVVLGHAKVETTLRYSAWSRVQLALDQQRRFSLADKIAG